MHGETVKFTKSLMLFSYQAHGFRTWSNVRRVEKG